MKDLIIPIQNFDEHDKVEIEVRIRGKSLIDNFRLESFFWDVEDEFTFSEDEVSKSLARIHRLKMAINEYDKEWELIQIFTPSKDASSIQVLYRKKF
jgi:hypothetical protein